MTPDALESIIAERDRLRAENERLKRDRAEVMTDLITRDRGIAAALDRIGILDRELAAVNEILDGYKRTIADCALVNGRLTEERDLTARWVATSGRLASRVAMLEAAIDVAIEAFDDIALDHPCVVSLTEARWPSRPEVIAEYHKADVRDEQAYREELKAKEQG